MTEIERRLKAVLDHELDSWDDKDIERIAGDLAAAVGAAETTEVFGLRNPRTNQVDTMGSRGVAQKAIDDGLYYADWQLVSTIRISGYTPWQPVQ